jgi:mono/diheme cytochrome c family protein
VLIGGKPLFSLPAFIPVTFELAVLMGALGVVFSLFVASGLRPRFKVPEFQPGANDDRFVLTLKLAPGAERGAVLGRLRELGALDAAPWVENYFDRDEDCCDRELGPAGLALVFAPAVLVLCAIPLLQRNYAARNIVWDAGMMRSPAYAAYSANGVLPNGQTIQAPPAGTRARGVTPELYGAGPEEALRAGRELVNPLTAPTPADLARGQQLFTRICATCHGPQGKSDGPIIPKFPNPPSLVASHAIGLPDGQIFHIATHGQGLMKGYGDVLDAQDRWRLVVRIRAIQAAAAAAIPAPAAPAPGSAPAPATPAVAQTTPGSTP